MDTTALVALLVPLALAALDWVGVARRWQRVGYLTKPGVIFALLAWLWSVTGLQASAGWFAAGLLFCAMGDILLMLPHEHFKVAMLTFLCALACYTIGFNVTQAPAIDLPSIIIVLLVALASQQLGRRLVTGLAECGQQALRIPLTIYLVVLSIMLTSALLTLVRPAWEANAALACSAGGLLLYFSDVVFQAHNRLDIPAHNRRVWRRMTYQSGQILLILGVALQFA
jgi:uncharacterized membrane protein YhhN